MSLDVRGVIAWVRLYPFRTWLAFALAVVLSLVVGIVKSTSGPAGDPDPINSVTTPTPTRDADTDTVTAQVAADGLTLNHPGGASLTVPAGALPVGTVVAITKGAATTLNQLGGLQPDGVSWDVAASVEPPSIPVTLVIPYDPAQVPAGARPLVATFDDVSGYWLPVKTSAAPETGKLIAELPGFSLKTWIMDRAPDPGKAAREELGACSPPSEPDSGCGRPDGPGACSPPPKTGSGCARPGGTASWLEYQGQRLLEQRPDRPQCAGRKAPPWVKQVVVDVADNAEVSACVRADGDGFAVEAADNHGYPVVLDFDVPFVQAGASALDDSMDGLMTRLSTGTGGRRVLLLPTGTSSVEFNPPPAPVGTVQAVLRRDGDSMVRWLVFEIINDTPAVRSRFGPTAVECGEQALGFPSGGATPVPGSARPSQRVDTLLDCFARSLDGQLRAVGFNVAKDLWRSVGVSRLPAQVHQLVGALRWVRGLEAGNFAQLTDDLLAQDRQAGSAPVAISVRWAGAPRWTRPAGVRPLFGLPAKVSAPGPAGQHLASRLADRSYPETTGAWVNCADPPATLTYRLDGKFRRLTAVVGLADFAPAGFAARFALTADGHQVQAAQVSHENTAVVNLDLRGVKTLVVSAVRTAGACPFSTLPFGALGDAYLFP